MTRYISTSAGTQWLSFATTGLDALDGGSTTATATGGGLPGPTGGSGVSFPYVFLNPGSFGDYYIQFQEFLDDPSEINPDSAFSYLAVLCWDVRPLTTAQRAAFTSVTVDVISGLAFRDDPDPLHVTPTQPHIPDLVAAVPDTVVDYADLTYSEIDTGSTVTVADIPWAPDVSDLYGYPPGGIAGGYWAFPPRPFSSVSWTTLGSFSATVDTDGVTGFGHPDPHLNGGTWTIPVDLDTDTRNGRLVIVIGTQAQIVPDLSAARLSAIGSTWLHEGGRWLISVPELTAIVDYTEILDDQGNLGRTHFRAIHRD